MALITRFTRLFQADLHAVLDRLEEPDVLLRQAIREMEEDVAQRGRAQKLREMRCQQAEARIAEIARALGKVETELDLCFGAGNQTLTRALLRRRLEGERLAQQLDQEVQALGVQMAEQLAVLEDQRRRLEGMRQRAAIFEADPSGGDASTRWNADNVVVNDTDVEFALLREQQKRAAS